MVTGLMHLDSSATPGLSHADPLPSGLLCDLRTDHAGETGAVMIYRGILATTRDAAVRRFAQGHLATESQHLVAIERLLAPRHRSRLLPLWRAAGWLTGVDRHAGPPSPMLRLWIRAVGAGSRAAVKVCRRI